MAPSIAARTHGGPGHRRVRRRAVRRPLRPDAVGATLVVALTLWGFFKGLYDANIFASAFDVVPPEARGRTAGFMNMIGWLAGGGSAPLVIGLVASARRLGVAMALTSVVYILAGLLLVVGMAVFPKRDVM